jgi:FlaA1/EpsC-like NDP-sugar epimerase
LQQELKHKHPSTEYRFILTDIRNEILMENIFEEYGPHIIYHAAAYKHVPLMEQFPWEAVQTNVFATYRIVMQAVRFKAEKFVFISSDKAVNPTSVMGATKRLAEIIVQSFSSSLNGTCFVVTRFGNVLGSNGSVVPLFKKQIQHGGPVTVTHPEMTRYFMTIAEACQLVLEASVMAQGGEVFVFDMGEPVKIADLAKKMIRLYGLIPNIDVSITYSGLRPGEKLYEELLTDDENTMKTYHEKIMIAKVRAVDFESVCNCMDSLYGMVEFQEDESVIVSKIKEFVPEFLSNNSVFEKLDHSKVIKLSLNKN